MSNPRYIQTFFVGLAMGIANVIPGVSGGTIALVGGVYEDIFASLKGINTKFIYAVLSGKFREAFRQVNGLFLGVLFLGVALGIILLANVLSGLLCTYPKQVNALFFGLILASVYSVGKRISSHSLLSILLFLSSCCLNIPSLTLLKTSLCFNKLSISIASFFIRLKLVIESFDKLDGLDLGINFAVSIILSILVSLIYFDLDYSIQF